MQDACRAMKGDYIRKNQDDIEKNWIQADDNEKARIWPRRLLQEAIKSNPSHATKVLVVEVEDRGNEIQKISGMMNLYCELKKMPNYQTGQRHAFIGQNREAVRDKIAKAKQKIKRHNKRMRKKQKGEEETAQGNFDRRFELARSKPVSSQEGWNICGTWKINCVHIQDFWGSKDDFCSFKIGLTKLLDNGLSQMYADFDFIRIRGIMRFICLNLRDSIEGWTISTTGKSEQQSVPQLDRDESEDIENKENRHEHNEEADSWYTEEWKDENESGKDRCEQDSEVELDEEEINSKDYKSTLSQFLMPQSSLPSSVSRKFGFRWRGEEMGEGEIQLDSDKDMCMMTFISDSALTGFFTCEYIEGRLDSKGVRVTSESEYLPDPQYSWTTRSEAAYRRAEIERWR